MSEIAEVLATTAERLVSNFSEDEKGLWAAMAEAGLLQPFSVSEGGFGWADCNLVVGLIGANAPFSSVADAMAADAVLSDAGMKSVDAVVLADGILNLGDDGTVSGNLIGPVLGDLHAHFVASVKKTSGETRIAIVEPGEGRPTGVLSENGRARYFFEGAKPVALGRHKNDQSDQCLLTGALIRSMLIAGAASTCLSMTVEYCKARVQFGRPLIKLQAVQQMIAQLAAEAEAAAAISRVAARRFESESAPILVAAARVRSAKSTRKVVDFSHQCHGAMGFTKEYRLGRFTRAMMEWRREFGDERDWTRKLGKKVADETAGDRRAFWRYTVSSVDERLII
jgi:acyl-CoA dehydrogenase